MKEKSCPNKKRRITAVFICIAGAGGLCLFLPPAGQGPYYQNYAPLGGHPLLTSLLALLPAVLLLALMTCFRMKGLYAAGLCLLLALLLAVCVWGMPPALAGQSALFGMLTGLFPVLWTLLNAIWIFNMLQESGCFETLKQSLRSVSPDRRIQALLVGFGFTALLESIAAFGAPIAIATAMLMGLGFPPSLSAAIALLADSAPSVWGTQSMPITILGSVTGIEPQMLGGIIALQAPVLSALLPLGLVVLVSGRRGLRGVWPIAAASGLACALAAYTTAKYAAVYAAGSAAGVAAILVILACLKVYRPRKVWLFPGESTVGAATPPPLRKTLQAWSPYIALIAIVGLVNGTGIKDALSAYGNIEFPWPGLHAEVFLNHPISQGAQIYDAIYKQNLLTTGGTLVFLAGVCSMLLLRLPFKKALGCYGNTLKALLPSGGTIVCILAIAYLMNYSGMTYSIGLALPAVPPGLLPVIAVLLGMLGCVLGGSVASGNALFGNLSVVMAARQGVAPTFIAATLCSGGTLGKPLTPQNLVIANAAIQQQGGEDGGPILARIAWMLLIYTTILALLATAQYFVLYT